MNAPEGGDLAIDDYYLPVNESKIKISNEEF